MGTNEIWELIKAHKAFAHLTEPLLQRIQRNSMVRHFARGKRLVERNTPATQLTVVLRGQAAYLDPVSRKERVLSIIKEPVLGGMEVWSTHPYLYSVSSMESGIALVLKREELLSLANSSTQFALNLIRLVNSVSIELAACSTARRMDSIDSLVTAAIRKQASAVGRPDTAGILIPRGINRTKLARDLGRARLTVQRALRRLERQGIIRRVGRDILIPVPIPVPRSP